MAGYIGADPSRQKDTQNRVSYSASNGQTSFAATYSPGYVDVYQNGLKLQNGVDFTALTGTSITLTTPTFLADNIDIVSIKASSPYDFYTKAQADLKGGFYGVAVGTGDAMTVTLTPTPTSLVDGMEFKVRVPGPNTAASPALTVMGLGISKTIYKLGGKAVVKSEWQTGQEITLRYVVTGDKFELVSNSAGITVNSGLSDASGTINWDIDTGLMATVTLTSTGRTFANPTNIRPGTVILVIKQDATGSRTITTWGSAFKWANGVVPTLTTTANSVDIVSFVSDGINMYGAISRGFA